MHVILELPAIFTNICVSHISLHTVFVAVLPVMVETVLSKIRGHITEQCLICCDVGVPCGARQACNDPSSLIFPFQVGHPSFIWL